MRDYIQKSVHTENYPSFNALWHLQVMGVRDANHQPNGWSAQRTGRTRVAMIDTSVAPSHPNLQGVIKSDLAIDLYSSRLGVFPYLDEDKLGHLDLNSNTSVAENLPGCKALLVELNDRLTHGSLASVDGVQPMTSEAFSGHGTAIAGLIGARPAVSKKHNDDVMAKQHDDLPLPYVGVDPECEIVPISTNFDPEPRGLIIALLYAELIRADVIVMPRIIPDPIREMAELNGHEHNGKPLAEVLAPVTYVDDDIALWKELTQLMVNISQARPIVCAAGNSNEEFGIYPANLASDDNGIISVGAVNAKGFISGYSSANNITVHAPSDDSEVFDRSEIRLDERRDGYNPEGIPTQNANDKFSSFDIISTDVPGKFGYSGSAFGNEMDNGIMREFGSYYCRFGGTSAASALIAGFLALGKTSGELADTADGIASKTWLLSKCKTLSDQDLQFRFPVWTNCVAPDFPDS
ncbi:S8/S53 family peptidase [Parasulfitobacter algicola]|uniref:S8 family serine peptidase n=1 Tax=Parasulfitobacter algicola TaxID=2614809 RepID=A0ABX2IN89_9RHOB|nr:S8/S53 family peptidase [Sulfitobacter algicola]NSX54347.1 S8 family serine peptidase [Sulfitobacter algicola]